MGLFWVLLDSLCKKVYPRVLTNCTANFVSFLEIFPIDGFFSGSAMCFLNLQKEIFQKAILNLKFKIPAHNSKMLWAGISNFQISKKNIPKNYPELEI